MNRSRSRHLALVVLLLALVGLTAAACGSDEDAEGVEISDAWVRSTPEGATAGAAYMIISSQEGDRLVGASVPTDVAGTTEIHETVAAGDDSDAMTSDTGAMDETDAMGEMEGMGEMTMREVAGIDVPARGSVALEPGGYHVMLLDVPAPLAEGDTVTITLTFETAGTVTVEAPVRSS